MDVFNDLSQSGLLSGQQLRVVSLKLRGYTYAQIREETGIYSDLALEHCPLRTVHGRLWEMELSVELQLFSLISIKNSLSI
jgi:hypothetical protein